MPNLLRGFRPKGVGNWIDELEAALRSRIDHPETLARGRRIAETLPQVTEVYSPDAVARAVLGTAPKQLTAATPKQFLQLAHPLDVKDVDTRRLLDYYKAIVEAGENQPPPPGMFTDWYEKQLMEAVGTPYKGFDDVPFLDLRKVGDRLQIKGHEGRHRNQVLSELYGEDTPFLLRWYSGSRSEPLPEKATTLIRNEPGTAFEFFRPDERFAGGGLARALLKRAAKVRRAGQYDNCQTFACQITGEDNLKALPRVEGEPQVGDILRFGDGQHYAVRVSPEKVLEVEEWGARPRLNTLEALLEEYDPPVYHRPNYNKAQKFAGGGLARAARAALPSLFGEWRPSVVKPKGGAWLQGSTELALGGLKRNAGLTRQQQMFERDLPEALQASRAAARETSPEAAINRWIDNQLTSYVRNRLASPDDDIRIRADRLAAKAKSVQEKELREAEKLRDPDRKARAIEAANAKFEDAMRFAIHFDPAYTEPLARTERLRREFAATQPSGTWGHGQSKVAQRWEDIADNALSIAPVEERMNTVFDTAKHVHPASDSYRARMQEFNELGQHEAGTPIYHMPLGDATTLHFDHLIDELENALTAGVKHQEIDAAVAEARKSGAYPDLTKPQIRANVVESLGGEPALPSKLGLTPSQLDKATVDALVEHVANINRYRYEKQAAEDAAKAYNPAVHRVADYDTGHTLVEFKGPEGLPEGWVLDPEDPNWARSGKEVMRTVDVRRKDPRRKQLEEALQYEGDTMKHCVSGYCPHIEAGDRIWSLRRGNKPVVTMHAQAMPRLRLSEWPKEIQDRYFAEGIGTDYDEWLAQHYPDMTRRQYRLSQVFGPANTKPAERDIAAVQRFIRESAGDWREVSDYVLDNAQLYKAADPMELGMYMPEAEDLRNVAHPRREAFQRAKEAGKLTQPYLTRAEWEDILRQQWREEGLVP